MPIPKTTSPSAALRQKFPNTLEMQKPQRHRDTDESFVVPLSELAPRGSTIYDLPYPPSYNRYWRTGSRGSFIAAAGKEFKKAAAEMLGAKPEEAISTPVIVYLDFYRPRRSGDLDNRIKQVLDALQGHAYADDSQIIELHARRFEDKANPRVNVAVVRALPDGKEEK